jgi:hypothetical protein
MGSGELRLAGRAVSCSPGVLPLPARVLSVMGSGELRLAGRAVSCSPGVLPLPARVLSVMGSAAGWPGATR